MGSTPIASTSLRSFGALSGYASCLEIYMKKTILISVFILSVSNNMYSDPKVSASINFSWKENVMKAAKKFAAFIFASRYVHGTAISVGSTLILDVVITALMKKQEGANILLRENTHKPPTSILLLTLAAAYGSYLSAHPPKKTSDLLINSTVAGAITGAGYLLWRLIRERTSEEVEICTFKNNVKGCAKHALLNTIAVLTSYCSTQQLKKLDY